LRYVPSSDSDSLYAHAVGRPLELGEIDQTSYYIIKDKETGTLKTLIENEVLQGELERFAKPVSIQSHISEDGEPVTQNCQWSKIRVVTEDYIERDDDRLQRPMIAVEVSEPGTNTCDDVWFIVHDFLNAEVVCQMKLDIFGIDISGWEKEGLNRTFQVVPSSRVYEVLHNEKDITHKNRLNK
jgi:hypothetical protein